MSAPLRVVTGAFGYTGKYITRELLTRGVDVNAANVDGVTALMIAAAHDNSAMIGLLLQAGADPRVKSANGETARDIAAKNDNLAATRTLNLLEHIQPN